MSGAFHPSHSYLFILLVVQLLVTSTINFYIYLIYGFRMLKIVIRQLCVCVQLTLTR